jgi:integrase/recombinase XerD
MARSATRTPERLTCTLLNCFWLGREERRIELVRITPRHVGQYLDGLRKRTSVSTSKQHLAALRHFFDSLVTRHAIILNPALSVRAER